MAANTTQSAEREGHFERQEEITREERDMARWALDEASERASHNLDVIGHASGAMFNGMQEMVRELTTWQAEMVRHNFETAIGNLQGIYAGRSLQRSFDGFRRMGEILIRMSDDARQAADMAERGREAGDRGRRSDTDDRQRTSRGQRGPRAA